MFKLKRGEREGTYLAMKCVAEVRRWGMSGVRCDILEASREERVRYMDGVKRWWGSGTSLPCVWWGKEVKGRVGPMVTGVGFRWVVLRHPPSI